MPGTVLFMIILKNTHETTKIFSIGYLTPKITCDSVLQYETFRVFIKFIITKQSEVNTIEYV